MTILIVVVPFLILEFMQGSRIAHLITLFSIQPSSMLTKDFSITDDFFFFFHKGFYDNFMLQMVF